MIHVDVKKLGRIPRGGGWRLHGRDAAVSVANRHKKVKIGYDYVHTAIDDHTRLVAMNRVRPLTFFPASNPREPVPTVSAAFTLWESMTPNRRISLAALGGP